MPTPETPSRHAAPTPTPTPKKRGQGLPDLGALETFVAVCESGSMVLAARRLGISQSAVSQMVKVLECEYGTRLFDRDVRPARPTRAGDILLHAAVGLLADARGVGERLRHSMRQEHAQIRLGCVDSFAATVGPSLVRALSGTTRQLQLWSGLTPGLNSQLIGRELDLAICTEPPPGEPLIAQRLLFSESWVAVFPRSVTVRAVEQVHDLRGMTEGLPLIRYPQRSVIGQQIDRFLRRAGLETPQRFEFDATDPLLSLVAAGLGWAISTPLCLWQSRAWLNEVQVVPLHDARLGQRDFHLLCRDAEWSHLGGELARLVRQVLANETLPALRASMPGLPAATFSIPEP